jgi:transcriptional regulator with XRE-family HTH domain
MDDLARLVGERLRAARQARGLSVGALAEAAGVGKGSLSEIENGIRNPTLGTLYSLAGALGVPLATLINDQAGVRVTSPGVKARLLDVTREARQTVEVYRLRIEPGVHHRSVAHGPGVVEHLLVTAGRLLVGRLGEETEIAAGSATQWVSDVLHTYTALGAGPVESVLVIMSAAEGQTAVPEELPERGLWRRPPDQGETGGYVDVFDRQESQ